VKQRHEIIRSIYGDIKHRDDEHGQTHRQI